MSAARCAAERRVSRITRACLTSFRGHEKADHGVRDAVGSGDRRRSDQAHARTAAPTFRLTRSRIERALTAADPANTTAVTGATTSGPTACPTRSARSALATASTPYGSPGTRAGSDARLPSAAIFCRLHPLELQRHF